MKHPLLLLLLVAVAGCRMEGTFISADNAAQADSLLTVKERLRAASRRSAAYADSVTGNHSESPNSSAAKIAAVMAANDITLPQVAAYLGTYGLDVVQQSAWRRVHFAPAPDAYWYEHELRFADGDTAFEFQLRGVVDQARAFDRVRGVNTLPNGTVQYGPWSDVGHDAKAALPGIGEYAK